MLKKFYCKTEKSGMINITKNVLDTIAESGVSDGVCVVACPHTTAGIAISEIQDQGLTKDTMFALDKLFFQRAEFSHSGFDTPAHLKAMFSGASVSIIIEDGKPLMGLWQGIYFCEFDAPRNRGYFVKVIEG